MARKRESREEKRARLAAESQQQANNQQNGQQQYYNYNNAQQNAQNIQQQYYNAQNAQQSGQNVQQNSTQTTANQAADNSANASVNNQQQYYNYNAQNGQPTYSGPVYGQQQYYNYNNAQQNAQNTQQYYNSQNTQQTDANAGNGQQTYNNTVNGQQTYGQQQYYNYNAQNAQQTYDNQANGQQQYYNYNAQNGQQYSQNGQPYGQQQYYNYNQQTMPEQESTDGKKKKKRKKRKVIMFIIEVILLLILAAGLYVAAQISKLSGISNVNTAEQDELRQSISAQLDDDVEASLENYWNIALYGVDSRDSDSTSGLSDTIMICSINKSTKEVKLVSVYRDTYLEYQNGSYGKATEAYLTSGASGSMNMLNKNFDLDIVNYVTVNMYVVASAVDAVGGVDLNISADEMTWINNYENETSGIIGQDLDYLTEYGDVHLNGLQAMSYCRIRYVGDNDYERTERQRRVLSLVLEKVQANPTLLLGMIDDLSEYISTNLTSAEIMDMAKDVSSYSLVDTTGFPFEKQAVQMNNDCVVAINLAQNVTELHQYLFANESYSPSTTVQNISDYISSVSGIY